MKTVLTSIQVLVIFSVAVSATPIEDVKAKEDTLVLLHVLFRHGNRTPDKNSIFPNDLYVNYTYEPYGYGQLTTRGKQTEYNIGKYLRENYDHLIPEQYSPDVVYAIATNVKRTKMSLELVLASLFPPLDNERIEENLDWQPVPFNIEADDKIMSSAMACPNYLNQYYSYVLSRSAEEIIVEYQDLYDRVGKLAGIDIITPRNIGSVYFTLKSQEDLNLNLPAWASDIYPEVLEEATSVDYEFETAYSGLKKLSAGFLLRKIIQDSLAKQNGSLSADRKVFLYSAHEYNVGTMLRALNVFWRHVPPFGATIFFEIHDIKGKYALKLYYQDYSKGNGQPRLLSIPGCSTTCPLDKLVEVLADSIPGSNDVCSSSGELM